MATKLQEFTNNDNQLLRGILVDSSKDDNEATIKDKIVIMLGGFERAGTTEKKFKKLADRLCQEKIDSFRFDANDCGLSDGDFYNMTTAELANDLISAQKFLKDLGYQRFLIIGHSLAGCAIALILNKISFEKIVLIAPALNQKDLLRLWFAQKNNKEIKINWQNYKEYCNETEFLDDLKLDVVTKSHKLNYKYRFDNQNLDYSLNYQSYPQEAILLVHGTNDDKVPVESLNIDFSNKVLVEKGDHDLEQPQAIEQWLDVTINFLKEK